MLCDGLKSGRLRAPQTRVGFAVDKQAIELIEADACRHQILLAAFIGFELTKVDGTADGVFAIYVSDGLS